jgi:siroheme synthase
MTARQAKAIGCRPEVIPATPAVAVLSATRPSERAVSGAVLTLPELIVTLPDEGPVIVLIGAVLRNRAPASRDLQGHDLAALGSSGCREREAENSFLRALR